MLVRVSVLLLLLLVSWSALLTSASSITPLGRARRGGPFVSVGGAAEEPAQVSAPVPAPAASSSKSSSTSGSLSHPNVKKVPLIRSATTSRKLIERAAEGQPAYMRQLFANQHGANLNAQIHQEEVMALRRHNMRVMAVANGTANDTAPTAPPPTVTPLSGCPFSDFTIPVAMGSKVFRLLVDTGSTTLAVAGDKCTSCTGVSPLWSASAGVSTTQNLKTGGAYGDSTGWLGTSWTDDVQLVDEDGAAVTDKARMRIAVIDSQSTPDRNADGSANDDANFFFQTSACNDDPTTRGKAVLLEGIIGLAFQRLSATNTDGFLPKLWDQRDATSLVPRVFAMQMCENTGAMWMGGYDASYWKGEPVWTPIVSGNTASPQPATTPEQALYYTVDPVDVYVEGESMGFTTTAWPKGTRNINIIDSGTTLWELPAAVYRVVVDKLLAHPAFKKYFRSAPTNNFFEHSTGYCDTPTGYPSGERLQRELPTISLRFANGATITMDGVGSYMLPCSRAYNQFTPGIASGSSGLIGGWPLMNQFITIHDVDNMRLGFAPVSQCESSLPILRASVSMDGPLPPTDDGGDDGNNNDNDTSSGDSNDNGNDNAASSGQGSTLVASMITAAAVAIAWEGQM